MPTVIPESARWPRPTPERIKFLQDNYFCDTHNHWKMGYGKMYRRTNTGTGWEVVPYDENGREIETVKEPN